jgi:hypothetical protein
LRLRLLRGRAGANISTNVYDTALYNAPDDDPTRMRKPKTLGPFNVDVYEYPPPFLAVPRSLQLVRRSSFVFEHCGSV